MIIELLGLQQTLSQPQGDPARDGAWSSEPRTGKAMKPIQMRSILKTQVEFQAFKEYQLMNAFLLPA